MLPRVAGSPVMSLMPLLPNSSFSTLSVLRHPIASASASTTQDAVSSGGPLLALIGFCVLPFFWSVPEALVTAELATAFPEDSGYVAWVTAAFGPYWGFQEGFWSWCACSPAADLLDGVILSKLHSTCDSTMWAPSSTVEFLSWACAHPRCQDLWADHRHLRQTA